MIGHLAIAMYLAGQTPAAPPEPVAPGSVVEQMKTEAVAMTAQVESPLAKEFLSGFQCLPPLSATRAVHYNKETRDALSDQVAKGMTEEQLKGYDKRDLDEKFFYLTRYGTPVAFTRPMEILGRAGVKKVDGLKIVDFGFGSIGQLRAMAALGADAVGIEVDPLLKVLYSDAADTGKIKHCDAAGKGRDGSVKLVFGQFPANAATVSDVGKGFDVFVSKNTLKHGYIHPEQEVDPRMLVHLDVDDEGVREVGLRHLEARRVRSDLQPLARARERGRSVQTVGRRKVAVRTRGVREGRFQGGRVRHRRLSRGTADGQGAGLGGFRDGSGGRPLRALHPAAEAQIAGD